MPTPLGDRIREIRRKRGLTLEGLAAMVSSSKSYMWEIENKNVARPSAEKLARIATALETTTEYLLDGESEEEEEDADDIAFFRRYKRMDPAAKTRLRKIFDALDDD